MSSVTKRGNCSYRPAPEAQHPKVPRVGYLGGGSAELEKVWLDAFLQGLREVGYVENKNIVVERGYAAVAPGSTESGTIFTATLR